MAQYPDLFVLRHGETEWNVRGKFQGRKDSPLTAKGKAQARKQGSLLAGMSILPRAAYTSPQGRALQTAHLALGSNADILIDDGLQEIDFGDWEGATRDDVKTQIDYSFESGLWNFRSPGGEDFLAICQRIEAFLNKIAEPSIIVTHGTTSMVLRGLWLGLNQTGILSLPRDQGCIFHLSNGRETIIR